MKKVFTVTWEHPLDGVIYTETVDAGTYVNYNGLEPVFPDDK